MLRKDSFVYAWEVRTLKPNFTPERESVQIGPMTIKVWPGDLPLHDFGHRVITMANTDIVSLKQEFVDILLDKEKSERPINGPNSKAVGGQKLRNLERLNSSFFELLNERAKALFMFANNVTTAVVDDCWANVFTEGEYILPHAHKRCQSAVVFSLVPIAQEVYEQDRTDGQLYIMDPRLPFCCPIQKGYATRVKYPISNNECHFVTFPGFVLHGVTPYRGPLPRISISWNINETKLPGEVTHDGVPRATDKTPMFR